MTKQRQAVAVLAALALAVLASAAAFVWARGDGGEPGQGELAAEAGPVHVHGLGVDPADGSLFIATHTGMWRVPRGSRKASRVGTSFQDTMGFTVVGPNRFLGSGHPDVREARRKGLPPLLGLIESRDAGRTWKPVSLLGQADFHVLESRGRRVYGYDVTNRRLLASSDAGRTWTERPTPGSVYDLALEQATGRRLAAATDRGLFVSADGGRSWQARGPLLGLLAWPTPVRLYVVTGPGRLFVSRDGGWNWERARDVGGAPAALLSQSAEELYVALHDGTVKRSTDGGRTWRVFATP